MTQSILLLLIITGISYLIWFYNKPSDNNNTATSIKIDRYGKQHYVPKHLGNNKSNKWLRLGLILLTLLLLLLPIEFLLNRN